MKSFTKHVSFRNIFMYKQLLHHSKIFHTIYLQYKQDLNDFEILIKSAKRIRKNHGENSRNWELNRPEETTKLLGRLCK